MEDEVEEDADTSDFCALKKRKSSLGFTILGGLQREKKSKNKRSLSLKATRTIKKKEAVAVGSDGNARGEDELEFCPSCQAPFFGLGGKSTDVHVQECLENKEKASVICLDGINCNVITPQHFKKFSHQQLADSRSTKRDNKVHQTVKKQSNCSSESKHDKRINVGSIFRDKDVLNQSTHILPSKTSESCSDEKETAKVKDTKDMVNTLGLSERKCAEYGESDELNDEISRWLNDDLKYEDLELVDVGSTHSCTHNSDTTCSTYSSSLSQSNINFSTHNQSRPSVKKEGQMCGNLSSGNLIKQTAMKQMDIGAFFGLKPRLETEKIGTTMQAPITKVSHGSSKQLNKGETSGKAAPKKCPFYKIVDGTSFAVDAFSYGNFVPGVTAYFLSHFHYDHYCGLKKSFSNPIYCSQVTANLISLKIKVGARFIKPLPLHETVKIQNVEVTLLDANHCPGAVMFIFKLPNGKTHLHTGDFRAVPLMEENTFLRSCNIHTLYLDTTYCDPDYSFPPQSDTVNYCTSLASETVSKNPKTLIVVGTYTIGKEKIFIALAHVLQCKVGVRRDKHNILQCLESKYLKEIITQNYKDAQIHVLPMGDLNHKKLATYLEDNSSHYCEILAIKPTGWTFTNCDSNLASIKPSKRGAVTIYGVPYSEHSSYKELEHFVQFIKPYKIIPTVNNGSAAKRDEMSKVFKTWLKKV